MNKLLDEIKITYHEKPELNKPTLIVGLSGVGNVGLIAAHHLIKNTNAKKFAEIHSPYFIHPLAPVPGIMSLNGVIEPMKDEIHYDKTHNLIILIGYYQGSTTESYYRLMEEIHQMCQEFEVTRIITLGGYGIGTKDKPQVYSVVSHSELIDTIAAQDVIFQSGLNGPIAGMSGLLIKLAKDNNIDGIFLAASTQGNYPDPRAAKEILQRAASILNIPLDTTDIDNEIQLLEDTLTPPPPEKQPEQKDYLSYIN
jgi:hypothetical protein